MFVSPMLSGAVPFESRCVQALPEVTGTGTQSAAFGLVEKFALAWFPTGSGGLWCVSGLVLHAWDVSHVAVCEDNCVVIPCSTDIGTA